MPDIIKKNTISFVEAKKNIDEYLQSSPYWEEIKDNLPDSTINIITELVAGFAVYQTYNSMMMREETYLQTAKLPSSVYTIAKIFGYPINRFTAPMIKVRYNGIPTKKLFSGDILGKYKNYDIVYFGEPKIIEKGDDIVLYLGFYQEKNATVVYKDEQFTIHLQPEVLQSIENNLIRINHGEFEVSKDIEDYVIENKIVDFSDDIYSNTLYFSNRVRQYGLTGLDEGASLSIEYIETDGTIDDFDFKQIQLDDDFDFISLEHTGTNGDSLDKIRWLAPLYYSTMRRMVTKKDHKFMLSSHPYLKSVAVERDEEKCCTVNVYYVKYNTTNNPIVLTETEQIKLTEFIDKYKVVGVKIVLIPAVKQALDFRVKVRTYKVDYQDYVREQIISILRGYELKLETPFEYGKVLAEIAKINIVDNNEEKKAVDYILPNQKTYDIPSKVDTYLKFDNIDITFVE